MLPPLSVPAQPALDWAVAGLRHPDAALRLRERYALEGAVRERLLSAAARLGAGPVLVLSTCNRVEIHARADAIDSLVAAWAEVTHTGPAELRRHVFRLDGWDAVTWLLRTTCGLTSQLVGDTGIKCQVRAAYDASRRAGTVDAWLHRLVQTALSAHRTIRQLEGFSSLATSHAARAVEWLVAAARGRQALVLGGGHLGQGCARRLARAGFRTTLLASDTQRAAGNLPSTIEVAPLALVAAYLRSADVIVGASPAVDGAWVTRADLAASPRPRWIVDLAVPRSVDAAVATLPDTVLHDVESLPLPASTADASQAVISGAEASLAGQCLALQDWWNHRTGIRRAAVPARLATRGSRLALEQVTLTTRALGVVTESVVVDTRGDRDRRTPLQDFGRHGVFTDELDDVLRAGDADIAVHSCKDLPLTLARDLQIAALLPRADAAEVLVMRPGLRTADLARPGLRIGTCSVRRTAQWLARYPQHTIVPLRGNVETRVARVAAGDYDAIVLAAAGLARLGLLSSEHPRLDWMIPAPAQGAIALVTLRSNARARALAARANDRATWAAVQAELAFARAMDPQALGPVAAVARVEGDALELRWRILAADGTRDVEGITHGKADAPSALAKRAVADALLAGAADLLPELPARRRA